jgi:inositol hexakisphosphate/diphosphoinositol-pentakisphosphate kinase
MPSSGSDPDPLSLSSSSSLSSQLPVLTEDGPTTTTTTTTPPPKSTQPQRPKSIDKRSRLLSTTHESIDYAAIDQAVDARDAAVNRSNNNHRSNSSSLGRFCSDATNNNNKKTATSSVAKTNDPKQQKQPQLPLFIPAAEPDTTSTRIRLGICAMDKKARSKPMAEILSRLDPKLFHVIFFGDHVILHEPVAQWPVCDALIAFFSKGYPLAKAKDYVRLRKPFILNDLDMQQLLQDRRRVYDLLQASGIDVPHHVYLSRDGYVSTGRGDGNQQRDQTVLEFDDHIEVNGVTIHKPFVEKPVDAEDHNISIYYPSSAGGGCKKLFRKIGNRSSEFYPNINEVRRDHGSYIYEEFVETQGVDVKMYTVGTDYGHAEARKSPTYVLDL